MTHYKQLMDTRYLGAYSLEDGRDIVLTIKTVQKETIVGMDGKREDVIMCHWVENEKPMILNATNCKTITKLVGSPYIEKWSGTKIQIGSERVRAFGDVIEALRIRQTKPVEEKPIICESCGNVISGFTGMTANQVAAYTKKKYGTTICADCAKQANAKKGETNEQE